MTDFMILLPLLLIGLGAITLMLLSAWERLPCETAAYLTMVIFGLAFLLQLQSFCSSEISIFPSAFSSILVASGITSVTGLIVCGCGFALCMQAHTYFRQNPFARVEFFSLVLFAAFGMLLLSISRELITAFISLEVMSLAIYILVGFERKNLKATEALLKYLLLGAFAGGFFAMGAAFVYGGVGSTRFSEIAAFIGQNGFLSAPLLVVGVFLIFAALLFKVAAFPFHAWVLDVYDGASMPVSGFMATALKAAVFVLFFNIVSVSSELQQGMEHMLFWIIVLTLFGGNFIAIGQDSLKRMLAASGIVHSGYLLIALSASCDQGFSGAALIYYLAAYAVATVGLFGALSYLGGEGERRRHFDDFRGLGKRRPLAAAAITIFLLSMAGIPPTAGFMGKFYIIVSVLDAGQGLLAVLLVISSVISLWYYLRLVVMMYFGEPEEAENFDAEGSRFAPVCTFILACCVFIVALLPVMV